MIRLCYFLYKNIKSKFINKAPYKLGKGILPTGGAFGSDLVFLENNGSFLAFFFFGLSPSTPPVSSSSSSVGGIH